MNRRSSDRIVDILRAIERVKQYRDYLLSNDLELSEMAFEATLRNLAVIGEAVRALPSEITDNNSDIPWASIIGLRNVVVHEYFNIKPELIIDIIDHQLESLRSALSELG